MNLRKLLPIVTPFFCLTIQAKVYEYYEYTNPKTGKKQVTFEKNVPGAIKKTEIAEDVTDVVITLHEKNGDREGKGIIVRDFAAAIIGKEIAIGTATIIVELCRKVTKNDFIFNESNQAIDELFSGDWFLFRTKENEFGVFVNKKTYAHAVNDDGLLSLEKIGLSKNLKLIDLEKVEKKKKREKLFKIFESGEGPINVASLNSIWGKKGTKIKALVDGHGMTEEAQEKVENWQDISISGMQGNQFIEFFKQTLKIELQAMLIRSCYASSLNQLIFNQFTPQFAIFIDNYPGTPKVALGTFDIKRSAHLLRETFTLLHLLISRQIEPAGGWKGWLKRRPWIDKKAFRRIFASFIERGVAAVRLPGANAFRFIPTNEKTRAITHPELLAHEIKYGKNTPFTIDKKTDELILYMGIIMLPFESKKMVASPVHFRSGIPGPSHHYLDKFTQTTEAEKLKNKGSVISQMKNFGTMYADEGQFYKKLFFISQLNYENHEKIKKDEGIFPFHVPAGQTLELTNVAILKPGWKPWENVQEKAEYIFNHRGTYYHAKSNNQLQFKKIDSTFAEKKIAEWINQTKPLPIALQKATIIETEKKFRNVISRSLKKIDLEQELIKKEQILKITQQETTALVSVINTVIQNIKKIGEVIEKLEGQTLEALKNKIREKKLLENLKQNKLDMEKTAVKMYKRILEGPLNKTLKKKELSLLNSGAKIAIESLDISIKTLEQIKEFTQPEQLINQIDKKKSTLIKKDNKLISIKKSLPYAFNLTQSIQKLIDDIFNILNELKKHGLKKIEKRKEKFKKITSEFANAIKKVLKILNESDINLNDDDIKKKIKKLIMNLGETKKDLAKAKILIIDRAKKDKTLSKKLISYTTRDAEIPEKLLDSMIKMLKEIETTTDDDKKYQIWEKYDFFFEKSETEWEKAEKKGNKEFIDLISMLTEEMRQFSMMLMM